MAPSAHHETNCCSSTAESDCGSLCKSLEFDVCNSQEELCNEKCIVAAAAAECAQTCEEDDKHDDSAEHQHVHERDGSHPISACSNHLSKAFEQYKAYLETARCICLSVLDRGLPSTHCSEQFTQSAHRSNDLGSTHAHSTAHGLYKHRAAHSQGHSGGFRHRGRNSSNHEGSKDGIAVVKEEEHQGDCCSGHDHDHDHDHDAAEYHQAQAKPSNTNQGNSNRDAEKDSALEHVVLVVNGMTCSGCGNKLERTLKAAPGVYNVRVNFVMGNAEFSIDNKTADPTAVIKDAERATGFTCIRLIGNDQSIDILASGAAAKALLDFSTLGVTDVSILNKRTVRVSYDPSIIGARSLFETLKPHSDGLAPPAADPSVSSGRKHMYDLLTKTILAAVLTIPVVVLAWGDDLVSEKTRAYISIVLATLVQILAVPVFYQPALKTLIHDRSLEMDMLVTISITAAYLYSIVAFGFRMADRPLETAEFFETSTLLITLVLLGRLVAAFARIRAVAAVSLRSLQASTAVVVENGGEYEIDARLLQYGDRFKVLPHFRIPTDGVVVDGASEVDESMLTGESVPVAKQPGDKVIAGTVNGSGILHAQLSRLPGKNTVTDIAELVEEAANSKPKIQDLADRVASWFVPVVTSIAVIVTIVWVVVGLKVREESANKAVANAITYAVAVLAVSCPCALGLAVPMVLVVAGGLAARGGVVIKSADCTARSYKVTDIVFDKTGTLTEGDLSVEGEEYFDIDRDQAISIAKALVSGNNHPVSTAVAKHLETRTTPPANIGDIRVVPGAGVEAISSNASFRAGNPRWTDNESMPAVTSFHQNGMTTLLITHNSKPIALFGLRTKLRPEAAAVVAKLKERNIALHIVSGDQTYAVSSVATAVGIDNVAAHHTPAQKRAYVASLMGQEKLVMFCGDGTNDAVAVAQADVGIQLGGSLSSSDVTRGAADVVLLAGLEGIPFLIDVSRASFHRMVFNFVWSAVYNVLAILLAAGAFINVRIPPAYAGLGEIVSVLPVIFAALTMFLLKEKARE